MTDPELLTRMREICLALPEATEDEKWGYPHFCVNGKIFAGCGGVGDERSLSCKVDLTHADLLVANHPRVTRAPYSGRYGGIAVDATGDVDWGEVRKWVMESYLRTAPKRLAKLVE